MGFQELALQPGERLLMSGKANKHQTIGAKGGMLFLTNQRIVFQARELTIGSKFDEYALADIKVVGNSIDIKTRTNLISFNIKFYTKYNEKLHFVVTRSEKDQWVRMITDAVTSLAQSRVSVAGSVPEEQAKQAAAQIKAVSCSSCGAFVVLMSGTSATCEFCGHTVVG